MAEQERVHFTSPIETRRPYARNRFEVWSPKLNRRLTLYGELALYLWVILEANSFIKRYCERPYQTILFKKDRIIDFWVDDDANPKFILLSSNDEASGMLNEINGSSSFSSWLVDHGISIEVFTRQDYLRQKTFVDNWSRIIRFLSANGALVDKEIRNKVHRAIVVSEAIELEDLVKSIPGEDPVIIKSAVFCLLHEGRVKSDSLVQVDIKEQLLLEAV